MVENTSVSTLVRGAPKGALEKARYEGTDAETRRRMLLVLKVKYDGIRVDHFSISGAGDRLLWPIEEIRGKIMLQLKNGFT